MSALQELAPRATFTVDGYVVGCVAGAELAYVLTGEGELFAFDLGTGALRYRVRAHGTGANALATHPHRAVIATAGQDGRASLFDSNTGSRLFDLPSSSAWVEHLAWSPDGQVLATTCGKRVRLWSAAGEPLFETEEHESTVTGVQFGRDGKRFATSAYGGARLFSIAEKKQTRHFRWKGSLISLAWSPDDKVLVCGSQDSSVHFWRLSTGQDSEMTGYAFKPTELAWDSRASLLATGGDSKITVWDFAGKGPEGTRPIQLEAHKGVVSSLAFSPRRAWLASGAEETAVMLWAPRQQHTPVAFGFLDDVVTSVAWGPRGDTVVAGSAGGQIAVYEPTALG